MAFFPVFGGFWRSKKRSKICPIFGLFFVAFFDHFSGFLENPEKPFSGFCFAKPRKRDMSGEKRFFGWFIKSSKSRFRQKSRFARDSPKSSILVRKNCLFFHPKNDRFSRPKTVCFPVRKPVRFSSHSLRRSAELLSNFLELRGRTLWSCIGRVSQRMEDRDNSEKKFLSSRRLEIDATLSRVFQFTIPIRHRDLSFVASLLPNCSSFS